MLTKTNKNKEPVVKSKPNISNPVAITISNLTKGVNSELIIDNEYYLIGVQLSSPFFKKYNISSIMKRVWGRDKQKK